METDQKEIDNLLEKLKDLTLVENVALADFAFVIWNTLDGESLSTDSITLYVEEYSRIND